MYFANKSYNVSQIQDFSFFPISCFKEMEAKLKIIFPYLFLIDILGNRQERRNNGLCPLFFFLSSLLHKFVKIQNTIENLFKFSKLYCTQTF